MARLKSPLEITGTLDNLSFYETSDGIIVRRKWGPDKSRLKRDPAFKGVRDHSLEFGACAKDAKLLRDTLRPVVNNSCDNGVTPRLNKVMNAIKNLDMISGKGKRTVSVGLTNMHAGNLLKGFEFNKDRAMQDALKTAYSFDAKKGLVSIAMLDPKKHFTFPKGSTYAQLQAGHAIIDFTTRETVFNTDSCIVEKADKAAPVTLKFKASGKLKGLTVFVFSVNFMELDSGNVVLLKDKSCNAAMVF